MAVALRYLFGAPGADLEVSGDIRLSAARGLAGWDGYRSGRYDTAFRTKSNSAGIATTDAQDNAMMKLEFPNLDEDPGVPLEAQIILRVSEAPGRPDQRRMTKAFGPDVLTIGIKPKFGDVFAEGAEAAFDLIGIDREG